MTTHRVNDIVRGKNSRALAVVLEISSNLTRVKYLEQAGDYSPGQIVQYGHHQFEPTHPDAVGQHVRHRDGGASLGPVLSIGQAQLITVKAGTFFRDGLVRVAEPEKPEPAYVIGDDDVRRFQRAWEAADREGKYGERTYAGLQATVSRIVAGLDRKLGAEIEQRLELARALADVQDHLATARTEHARIVQAKCDEIVRLEQQIAESAAQRSEVRDCFIMGGEGLELKETPGAHISIKGADISPRGTIGALKNRADQAEARLDAENDKGGEARAVVSEIADIVGVDLSDEPRDGQRWSPANMQRVVDAVRKQIAALTPDPDAAAKAAVARFYNVSETWARDCWESYDEATRDRFRRIAAS